MGPQTVPEMAPEVLVVGQSDGCTALVARVREQGYEAEACAPAGVEARLARERMPGAVVVCTAGLDVADVMQRIRDTPLGATVVITLYGSLGDQVSDLADVLDLGADHFLEAPASDVELATALEELAGPAAPPAGAGEVPGGSYGSWPNRTEVLDGPLIEDDTRLLASDPAAGVASHLLLEQTPEPAQVIGQLHRTLDMLEQRLRDGGSVDRSRADRDDIDLANYGLAKMPELDEAAGSSSRAPDREGLGIEHFELPLAALTSPGGRSVERRAAASPESTVRLEETNAVEHASIRGANGGLSRSPLRKEPLEPELESELHRDRPRRARPLPIDRKGSLDVVEVPRLLWTLHRARFTGRLTLQRAKIEKSVWFEAGNFVFARSNVGYDRLSDGLLRRGVLTRSQYETTRRLAEREPRRAGQILVEAGFLKPGELHRVLRIHLARIIDSTFPWTSGSWLLAPDDSSDEPVTLQESPALVLAEGIRNRMEAAQLVDLVGGMEVVPRFDASTTSSLAEIVETLQLSPTEEAWVDRLDGRRTLGELTEQAGADEHELFGLVYLLHVLGHVDLTREPEPEPTSELQPSELDAQRIRERLRMSRHRDYFEVLGLDRDACRVDVQRAFADVSATFADDNLEPNTQRRLQEELTELRQALAEARDVLVDDGLRSAYLAHLEEP